MVLSKEEKFALILVGVYLIALISFVVSASDSFFVLYICFLAFMIISCSYFIKMIFTPCPHHDSNPDPHIINYRGMSNTETVYNVNEVPNVPTTMVTPATTRTTVSPTVPNEPSLPIDTIVTADLPPKYEAPPKYESPPTYDDCVNCNRVKIDLV